MTRRRTKPPWEQPRPRGTPGTPLSPDAKKRAGAASRRARRRYPNLVDTVRPAVESHGDRRLPVTRASALRAGVRRSR